jgi:hypothetical protein
MSTGLSQWFGFTRPTTPAAELPEIFPLPLLVDSFVRTDVVSLFSKILTDVIERTHGLSDEQISTLWDSCVKSNASDGLITLLSKAMTEKEDLFLVYEKPVNVIRVATSSEQEQIRADYSKQASSSVGVFISFKNFHRADMIKLYSALEYCTVASLYKSMNVSKATQLKFSDLRGSVALSDAAAAKEQAQSIATSLAAGRDIMLDAKDTIENATPDISSTEAAMKFLDHKRAFYLGLPAAYVNGEQTGGLSTTGEGDQKATERGLKNYFSAILKPVLDAIFGVKVTYKSQDFRQISGSMEVLKTFALIDEELVSLENKQKIVNQLLDLPENAKGDPVPAAPRLQGATPPPPPFPNRTESKA